MQAGGTAGGADAEEHIVLRNHGLAGNGGHDPAHGVTVRDRAQGRAFAHRLPEGAEIGLAQGAGGAAGEDVGAGLDLVHRLQAGQDLAPGSQHGVTAEHAAEVEEAVRLQARAQGPRVVEQPRRIRHGCEQAIRNVDAFDLAACHLAFPDLASGAGGRNAASLSPPMMLSGMVTFSSRGSQR